MSSPSSSLLAEEAAPAARHLRAEVLESAEALGAVRGEWAQLNEVASAGCLFLGPEWLVPWWKHFGEGRTLCAIAVRDGAALVGFLPLFLERAHISGLSARRLAFVGDGATGCDYLDLLAAPGREDGVLEAALGAVGGIGFDLCDLDGLRRDGPTALALSRRFPPRGRTLLGGEEVAREAELRYVCPYIPLTGTWDDFLAGLGRRENLRRREKWLARQPGFAVEIARSAGESALAIERFFELHRARWAAEGGSDGLVDPRHEAFHRDAVEELARAGKLRLYTLLCASRPVASVYGAVHGGKFYYYQSGYDPLWAPRSVGLVLLARTVKDAFAEGMREFDFLRGNEAYKQQWRRAERWTVRIQLFRGGRGRAARAALRAGKAARAAVKGVLPEAAVEVVRRARRLARAPRIEGETALRAALRAFRGLPNRAERPAAAEG